MLYIVKMPKLSPTMETGTIVNWRKNIGEYVKPEDVLLDISTDKSIIEYSILDEGWLREILVQKNEKATIGMPIAIVTSQKNEVFDIEHIKITLDAKDAELNTQTSKKSPIKETTIEEKENPFNTFYQLPSFFPEPPLSNSQYSSPSVFNNASISPLAKFLSKKNNLDISGIVGSGPGGRIIEKDLVNAPKKNIVKFHQAPIQSEILPGTYEEIRLSPMREIVSSRLQAAKLSIPHFYIKQEVNVQRLIDLKNQLNNLDIKLSYNDFITRACALTLKKFPNINSGFNSSKNMIVHFKTIDISFAVALDDGLITPIIRYADQKNIQSLSLETKALAKKAKNNQLQEYEYKGGSFCISNLGMTNIQEFSAIINPPQSAILAVGGIISKPVIENNVVIPGYTMTLTLSLDHRVVDGYEGALFIKQLQKLLENPAILLLN